MQGSLAISAALMGLLGGPHCVAMCGAACAGIAQATAQRSWWTLTQFQLGRVVGYALLGALAASSVQGLGWLTTQSAALRPLWSLLHLGVAALGLLLLWKSQQPVWLDRAARHLWRKVSGWVQGRPNSVPLLIGVVWALLPCGLLYSALLLASLSASAWSGAAAMAAFALGTAVSMTVGPWLWLRLGFGPGRGDWGVRLAGLALLVSALWSLWMDLAHNTAPWCTVAPV